MMEVTVGVAKTQLSWLIEAALWGEDVVIAKGEKPVVRLVPISEGQFRFGVLEPGALGDGPDFFFRWMKINFKLGRDAAPDGRSIGRRIRVQR
jgi:antitoxin (DNA-binding transcriptional repressor) of toxin-antitoxin stability system